MGDTGGPSSSETKLTGENYGKLSLQLSHVQSLELVTPILTTRKGLNAQIHQRIDVIGQTAILKSGERETHRIIVKVILPEAEVAGAGDWKEHLKGNYDKFLKI